MRGLAPGGLPCSRDEPWRLGPLRPGRMADLLVTRELAASPDFGVHGGPGRRAGGWCGSAAGARVHRRPQSHRPARRGLREAEALLDDLQAPLEELTTVADALSVAASRLVMPEPAIRLYARVAEMLPETTAQAVKAYWMVARRRGWRESGVRPRSSNCSTDR